MRFRLTTAALLLSMSFTAVGCSQNDKNADPSSSASMTSDASASATASGSASAKPSASDSTSAPSPSGATASDSNEETPGILISLPAGNEFKSFMKISDESASKVIKLFDGADWEKKESIPMNTSPKCKIAKLAGDRQTDIYYLWTDDAAAYELVNETGGAYAKLSKKDSAELAKLLPLPTA